jgi:asparagine synthase (glutamine-hydrolysing)
VCGIAGIVVTEPDAVVDAAAIRHMCQTIVHRGPDDEGIYAKGPVGLGMRRLSIIDVAGGHQPIHNEDKTIWIVFNGEIYNFQELRLELEKSGHRFYTNTDTEAIVHLYEEFGADCIRKLRGMFALAIYDERCRRLLLARDRLGKKPLHYAFLNGRLLFGSEIKALLAVAPELKEIDHEGLLQFFYFGYIPDPYTAFTRIRKLPPGHLLEFANGGVSVKQYLDLPAYGTYDAGSEEECLEELEHRLAEAVRIRLISDVPLGALLSGGVDSSTVVALMARASSKPVKTFSIGFRNEDFDEAHYARTVAQHFHTDHHELIVDPDFGETLDTLTHVLEEPFADSSMLPTYYLCRLARQHVTVALSGDGGDELFAGYDRYCVNLRRRVFDLIPKWAGQLYRNQVYPRLHSSVKGRKFAYNISLPSRERYLDGISFQPVLDARCNLFSANFLRSAERYTSPLEMFRRYLDHSPADDHLSRLLYLDTKTYLTADILVKVDRMSMANSLEVRVPMLDHVFLEWVTGLPAHWKFRRGTRKYILKKLARRLGVPPAVLNRRKQGFALPLVHWMRKELKGDLAHLLLEPRSLQRGYLKPAAVREILDEHFRGRRDRSGEIWMLLIFELWHRNFLETPDGYKRLQIYGRPPALVAAASAEQTQASFDPMPGALGERAC